MANKIKTISEDKVINALQRFTYDGKTILFVTHRPSIMKKADMVAFLKNKVITEQGSYKRLVNNKSFFLIS